MNILSKNRFLLMSVFLGLLTIGLPGHIPPVHATPNSATSCVSTDCPLSGIKSQSFTDPGNGYAASETKFDQPSGYSDGQMTGYGGNSPNIWIGVETGLGSGLRGLSNPNENIRTVEIDVSITDSSGNAFPLTASTLAAGTSVWDTPYPSGVSIDYASLITDLSGFVAGLVGVTVPPGIHFSVETPNGHNVVGNTFIAVWTGYPNPCQITSISNSCSSTGNTSNDSTKQVDKTLNVRVIPTFSSPDVYKFTISTRVERGDCYWSTVGDPRSGQVANSYYCRSLETLTQSYSFYYVYENEAGLNSDAADALPNAGGIVSVLQRGTYAGLLYRIDSVDVYGYSATAGEPLAFVETSPSTGDYSLTVYDNSYTQVPGTTTQDGGRGATNTVSFTAGSTAQTYYAKISLVSGQGVYSFGISDTFEIAASPGSLNLGLTGTASSTTSTITTSSINTFTGIVNLAASVSPLVSNGPTASISTNTVTESMTVNPTSGVSACSHIVNCYDPSNIPGAFTQGGDYTTFAYDCSRGSYADYSGYTVNLPTGATMTKVEAGFIHEEAYSASSAVGVEVDNGTKLVSLALNEPVKHSWTQIWWDITNAVNWAKFGFSALRLTAGDGEFLCNGTVYAYLDWIPLRISYTIPAQAVQLSAGGSGTNTLTVSSSTSTPPGNYNVGITGTSGSVTYATSLLVTIQDFTVSATPNSYTLIPGQSAPSTIIVSPINGFTGTVSLSANAPSGIQTSFSTNTITGGSGTSTLTISLNSPPSPDPATIVITATSGSRTQTTSISVLNPPPNFAISTSPNRIVTPAGQANTIAITVTSLYGFTGTVVLNAYVPSGLSCSAPSPPSVTLTTSSPTAPSSVTCSGISGLYTLNATGTSGSIGNFALTGFTIQDFTTSASPGSIPADSTSTSTITVTTSSPAQGVVFSFSSTLGTLSATRCTTDSSGSCMVTIKSNQAGTATITATSPGYPTHQVTVTFFDFSISAAGSIDTYSGPNDGGSLASTLTVSSVAGFTGTVTLTASPPPGFTTTFSTSSVSVTSGGSATSYVWAYPTSASTSPGSYTFTVTATSGSLVHQATVSLVYVGNFGMSSSPSSLTLNPGSTGTVVVTVTSQNGFSGTVGFSTSAPSGFSTSLSVTQANVSPSTSGSTSLTISVSSSESPGTYSVCVSGSFSFDRYGIWHQTCVSITVPSTGSGGGGGSVAAGTLITLADGTQVPVQSLKVGMQLLSYDMATHQYVTTTITRFVTVMTHNQMVISTSTGKPLVVDQNPAQKLYVKMPDGTVMLKSVTDLKVGYDLFDAMSQTWVPITSIHYENGGNHLMYDIYTTAPGNYIANGYLDPLKM